MEQARKNVLIGLAACAIIVSVIAYFSNIWIALSVYAIYSLLYTVALAVLSGAFGEDVAAFASRKIKINGVVVYKNSVIMASKNLKTAALSLKSKRIFVDKNFFALSAECQKFVLLHEEGHMTDTETFTAQQRFEFAINNQIAYVEVNADHYAFTKLGLDAVVNALKEMTETADLLSKKELELRVDYLINNSSINGRFEKAA